MRANALVGTRAYVNRPVGLYCFHYGTDLVDLSDSEVQAVSRMGVTSKEYFMVKYGEADENTRFRVAEAIRQNDPLVMELIEREQRLAREWLRMISPDEKWRGEATPGQSRRGE